MEKNIGKPALSGKHVAFADRIRTRLAGAILHGIGYQGLEVPTDETGSDALAKDCETIYPEIDRLDHALILHTDRGVFYVTWDGTFYPYGLNVLAENEHEEPAYSATLNASGKAVWPRLLGAAIDSVELEWDELIVTSLEENPNTKSYIVPIWMRFLVNETWVFIGAADLLQNDKAATMFMDNLLVTANRELAERVLHFPPQKS